MEMTTTKTQTIKTRTTIMTITIKTTISEFLTIQKK